MPTGQSRIDPPDVAEDQPPTPEARLFALSLDLLGLVGFDGYLKLVNPAWESVLGWTTEELLERPYLEFVHPDDRERTAAEALALAGDQTETRGFEIRVLCKAGGHRWIVLSAHSTAEEEILYVVAHDITDSRAAHEKLRKRERQLAAAQEIARIGSWEWDIEADRASWSDEMYRIYGLDPSGWDISYEEYLQRVHPDDRALVERTVAEARESHAPFGYEHRVVWPDGTVRVVLAYGEVVVEDGRAARMIGTCQDITERRHAEDALSRSNTDLANFAYVASHDLSEPLRIVSGYVELLASRYSGQLDEQADQFIDYTLSAVARMQKLIADLLAYSSVGSVPIASGLIDMDEVVREALDDLARMIEERGAEVEVDELPAVRGDEGLLGRLFQNLVSNAVKFSSAQQPRVTISAQRAEGAWRFTVTDNGIGIPAEDRRRIFQMFERGRARDSYPGTGMGLAICKRIVEQHGGDIWVEDASGGGSAFHFTLPDNGIRSPAAGS